MNCSKCGNIIRKKRYAKISETKGVVMKNELVIVRAFGGTPLVRRVWDFDTNAVYVSNVLRENPMVISLGLPLEDVFNYDSKLAESMDRLYEMGKWDWGKLTKWNPLKRAKRTTLVGVK